MNSTNTLQLRHIDFHYRQNHVLRDISLDIPLGTSVAILGENGSGKSTLLSILAGARRCRGASVRLDGIELLKNAKLRRKLVGYVPQNDPLLPELNVRKNLLLWYNGSESDLKNAMRLPCVSALQLESFLQKPVSTLSGGMRKRVSLACALINDPKILILDEPSAALDLGYKAAMRKYLSSYLSPDHTLILATHDEEDLSLSKRLLFLRAGALHDGDVTLRGEELLAALRGEA